MEHVFPQNLNSCPICINLPFSKYSVHLTFSTILSIYPQTGSWISVFLHLTIQKLSYISALLFQVKGDSDFANIVQKQIESPDTDPAYREILNFIFQVKYYG
jgi:hypothetical protein